MPRLSDVIAALDALWPPALAESWDAVGLVCGDPDAEVGRIVFAVDPVQEVVDEAVAAGAGLLVTHHPLYLRGTTTVAPVGPAGFKGRVVHDLIRGGVALYVAHTNADRADPGVSDALAAAVGLRVTGPLVPDPADPEGRRGLGRIGTLDPPLSLAEFAAQAARGLPATATGLRIAGDPAAPIRTVAVCGGSGDSLFEQVRAAGVDAYLTADLRHHPASEARQAGPPALLDAAHWATEWPWCPQAAREVDALAEQYGWALSTQVSHAVTDPWTAHAPSASPVPSSSPGAPR
ncbi:Nif3-like dinuclear metal center hexameric protein [Streptomyces cocklensis]|uniref:GTP cyclohydrolase 1 type 2 homolog n=1 Tax=Actinacidiphila cocklensis TaxID=887465 RepID=A0A9W4GRJ2_9ACTN|nr:Nif3-like dinuclear metal center hexameric protein [Actinacidiphila cocklensis]MDD1062392.1 Nif3-like dinuclear metal center hexameric protein [Actinacidiphila cocklensis]WSX74271.1 Nif3-like dinuclear metal center hexameric protein [Streptomyces sp. NBC_00899]WSX79664.1 Nif3-like dinuclear metal center hexameric protein [Streptomyces sp. NBC_00899]CAG6392681.1 GTP cyclohydrolase 1 type 2 homolog [Actinacidiphila cocklensis]